jgi:hypothetical protein
MSNQKIIVLRSNIPLRLAQPRTKKVVEQQYVIRELSSKLRELRNAQREFRGDIADAIKERDDKPTN